MWGVVCDDCYGGFVPWVFPLGILLHIVGSTIRFPWENLGSIGCRRLVMGCAVFWMNISHGH